MKTRLILIIPLVILTILLSNFANAHCDTKDGPVAIDAMMALEQDNVNYVLKWVQATYEKEINQAFGLTVKVRALGPEAETLADNYFLETLIRIHRNGEGVPYSGVKPAGTPVDEKILAADKSIVLGNLSPLHELVSKNKFEELKRRFDKVLSLKNFDVNNVQAAREYVEAYVQFFHFAEGEKGHNQEHIDKGSHLNQLPWILSGFLLITSILFGSLYYRSKAK